MAHELFVPFPPVINGVVIPHISDPTPNQNLKEIEIKSLGKRGPIDLAVAYEEPTFGFETGALDVLLGAGNLAVDLSTGLYCDDDNTILQYQQFAAEGGFAGAGYHVTLTSVLAWLGIESIKASQDETKVAMAKCMLHLLLSDGGTLPNVLATDADLTGAVALDNKWALGPVYINSTQIAGLQTIEYVSGVTAKPKRADGNTVANRVALHTERHEMRLGLENLGVLASQGLGMSNAAGACAMYLRHISSAGGRTANTGLGNNKHIKIQFSAAKLIHQELKSGGEDSEVQTVPTIVNTGTVSWSVVSTIP